MKSNKLLPLIFLLAFQVNSKSNYTFEDALDDLSQIKDLTVLKNGEAQIAVSAAFQGRVFTSSSKGDSGRSYGWFDPDVAQAADVAEQIHKLGGESRMWFGPEVGKFAIFFDPGAAQIPENVKISPELTNVPFRKIERSDHSLTAEGDLRIRNANQYLFELSAKRKMTLFDNQTILDNLNIESSENASSVGFEVKTWIKNTGQKQWKTDTGLLSIWDIGCIPPSPKTIVIIPTKTDEADVTVYFTEVDENRLMVDRNAVIYKGDAGYLNKIGIKPEDCKNVFGAYSPENGVLTIVQYNFVNDGPYVNSHWEHTEPYKGDVINVFNGEVTPELDRNWPFYELETSSSAKELKPGETMCHYQRIYHFEGTEEELNKISKSVLGVDLIKRYF